jgi:hypothetical protein
MYVFSLGALFFGRQIFQITDIIGLLVMSFVLLAFAVVWVHHLEKRTSFPPVMRISIVTRHHYRVAVVYFVVVSATNEDAEYRLTGVLHA